MSQVTFPSYNLRKDVLDTWLRHTFKDQTISAEPANGYYMFTLPQGCELTEEHQGKIRRELKGKREWAPRK
ncbi:Fc.00g002170.m01.CDS01 [Cosmosporella sp. VM-42]